MKHAFLLLATASTLLGACQTIPETGASSDRTEYKAHGTEPFWALSLANGTMAFSAPDQADVRVDAYEARPSFNGWRYVSGKITADVTFASCSDGMSDWTYKDSVTVMVDGKEYKGCGGGILPPKTLDSTSWQVTEINGEAIASDREAIVSFAEGRMSGSVGCNRLGASYTFAGGKLGLGPVMSTKMACPDPVGRQEFAFVTLLGSIEATSFPGDGTMVLTGKNGTKAVLKQSI